MHSSNVASLPAREAYNCGMLLVSFPDPPTRAHFPCPSITEMCEQTVYSCPYMHAQMQQECDQMATTQPLLIARAPLYPYSKCNEHVIQLWPPQCSSAGTCTLFLLSMCCEYLQACMVVVSTDKHVWRIGTCYALYMYCSWYFLVEVNSESPRSCSDLQPDWSSCSYPYIWDLWSLQSISSLNQF